MKILKLTNTIEDNIVLANKIMREMPENIAVKKICDHEFFFIDPIRALFFKILLGKEMIGEGYDEACAFIMGQIPNFFETATNPDYLKGNLIEIYTKIRIFDVSYNDKALKIMQVFERSIKSGKFQNDLNELSNAYNQAKCETNNFQNAYVQFQKCITIIDNSINLKDY